MQSDGRLQGTAFFGVAVAGLRFVDRQAQNATLAFLGPSLTVTKKGDCRLQKSSVIGEIAQRETLISQPLYVAKSSSASTGQANQEALCETMLARFRPTDTGLGRSLLACGGLVVDRGTETAKTSRAPHLGIPRDPVASPPARQNNLFLRARPISRSIVSSKCCCSDPPSVR